MPDSKFHPPDSIELKIVGIAPAYRGREVDAPPLCESESEWLVTPNPPPSSRKPRRYLRTCGLGGGGSANRVFDRTHSRPKNDTPGRISDKTAQGPATRLGRYPAN
jgi:hypothetical protein